MVNEALRKKAIESVDALLGDIESSVKRSAAVFGAGDLLTSLIPSFIGYGASVDMAYKTGETYTGERRNLEALLGCKDWVSTTLILSAIAKQDAGIIKLGGYFRLPIKAEAGRFGGLDFEALNIPEAEVVVVQTTLDGQIILNFEEVLFFSAINARDTNKGGFKNSALSEYLNGPFLVALDPIREVLAKNKDRNLVTLPTRFEVCGGDDDGEAGNWEEESRQFEYFKKIKNRIRLKDSYTRWWWLSTAVGSTYFAHVNNGGVSYGSVASYATGGVAPVFCIS